MKKIISLVILVIFSVVLLADQEPFEQISSYSGTCEENLLIKQISREEVIEVGEKLSGARWEDILKMGFANDYAVDLYRVKYFAEHPAKGAVLTSGLIMVPVGGNGKAFPVLSLQHGTNVKKSDAPSVKVNSSEVSIGILFCSEGFIVLMPDYIGMEEFSEILHPYCQYDNLGNSVIDLIRAFKELSASEETFISDGRLFLTGYSEGGYATMSAAKLMQEKYPGEFNITACAPMAGPYDISETMLDMMLSDNKYPSPYYLPYVILGYQEVYQIFREPKEIFSYPYYETIPPLFNGKNSGGTITNAMAKSGVPKDILSESFLKQIADKEGMFYNVLLENDVYNWKPAFPMKLIHSVSDEQVPYQNSLKAYNKFIENGVEKITLVPILGNKKHSEAAFLAIPLVNLWFKEFLKR